MSLSISPVRPFTKPVYFGNLGPKTPLDIVNPRFKTLRSILDDGVDLYGPNAERELNAPSGTAVGGLCRAWTLKDGDKQTAFTLMNTGNLTVTKHVVVDDASGQRVRNGQTLKIRITKFWTVPYSRLIEADAQLIGHPDLKHLQDTLKEVYGEVPPGYPFLLMQAVKL